MPSRTLLVTEVATGMNGDSNTEYFEIQNVSSQALNDTSGWVVAVSDSTTNISAASKRSRCPAPSLQAR